MSGKLGGTCDVRQILFLPLGIFNSYVSLIQIKIFFGTIRRISSPTNLAVTSWAFSWFLSPGLYGRVVYRGVTGSFFGIGILPVSDLLDFRYFGRYRSPLFCILPPFPPPFFSKRGLSFSKRGPLPPF